MVLVYSKPNATLVYHYKRKRFISQCHFRCVRFCDLKNIGIGMLLHLFRSVLATRVARMSINIRAFINAFIVLFIK